MIYTRNNLSGCISLLLTCSFSFLESSEKPITQLQQPVIVKIGAHVTDWNQHIKIERVWYKSKTNQMAHKKETPQSQTRNSVKKFSRTY